MKALLVASTRPEVIKLSPVMRALEEHGLDYLSITTGQHYDYALFQGFIKDLGLREPDCNIMVGSGSQADQTAHAMGELEKLMIKEKPSVVIVEGDTNSVLSSALAAVKLRIPVAHVEAGLRSYDKNMPEEVNRIIADHCSELLFAPTEKAGLNLINEGILPEKIFIVGNTIVDATLQNLEVARRKGGMKFNGDYLVLTLHRAENVDDKERLKGIIDAIDSIGERVVFPAHPRTVKRLERFGLEKMRNIDLIEPLGYLAFLMLLSNAKAVLTDSGGIQEEALVLNVPCFTLRTTTERPESVDAGGNMIVGVKKEEIIARVTGALQDKNGIAKMRRAKNPFGDGKSGERIVGIMLDKYAREELGIPTPDFTKGMWRRRFISVNKELEGKRLGELEFEVSRVINDGEERFPRKELKLKKGQIIEIIEKP
jgi:UDP-N-acetylglucosamine 2-epimerase (non-hydrolysing)